MINNKLIIIGPCSLESYEQILEVSKTAKNIGTTYLRTQVFKPRTNPHSFQGLGTQGIEILNKLSGFKFVMEACSEEQLKIISPVASIIQIGARSMQNFELLKSVGKYFDQNKHEYVLLKRGFANSYEEWIYASEYLKAGGVPQEKILLCERGSRSLTSPTGTHLDFLCALKAKNAGYKVIIDPSHGTGSKEFVLPMAKASLALELDGVMIECHPTPEKSVSDAKQALSLDEVESFFKK